MNTLLNLLINIHRSSFDNPSASSSSSTRFDRLYAIYGDLRRATVWSGVDSFSALASGSCSTWTASMLSSLALRSARLPGIAGKALMVYESPRAE